MIYEIVNEKDFEKSETEIESYESIELKYPQEYDSDQRTNITLDDFNDKKINDPRVQATSKQCRQISILIISQDYMNYQKITYSSS